ncbi:fasciclin domain-containing protein [Leeuwenhoekiella marinoflava]|uniref:Uncaracterized surface protein containing fasciclin (FAS1) repeats n=2 Tax=Leeuwenhoekiella marinoflava TaxID=988 RepID=A0ABY1HWR5_9FLAO|nr:fasciclin domain-containing protein [Leeuwenhoekiella marinoflava]RXG27609.1 putative surface protein with fasciclin (FAS1) repeats [Leeuwenhoekiella marinoflava]SHF66959.1 Uncaracterized surface protein containing fasciclin (FAS1) repeats [Leeuwenhoekiella marinoflava DSM 3653]
MTTLNTYTKWLFIGVLSMGLSNCSDPWDDRSAEGDQNLQKNLSERLLENTETSSFGQLLVETGYDSILKASKTFTVWAPTNEAMNQVDESILSDLEKSRLFIKNHITLSAYSSVNSEDTLTIHMLSNKYLQFIEGNRIAGSQVVTADQYTSNGIFYTIDQALEVRPNIWEYLEENKAEYSVGAYLYSLDDFNIYHRRDSIAKANPDAQTLFADSLTNSYLHNVYNLNNEQNKYTFLLMENDGFESETEKLVPYLNKGAVDSTKIYAQYFALRDMTFQGIYSRENLPDTLVSKFGVKVPLDQSQILEEIPVSNGIVYRMSTVDVPLEKRLLTTEIQGEEPKSFSRNDKEASTFYRERPDPQGGIVYDIMVQNHGAAQFAINYEADDMYSTTYQVYWRAVNDIQSNTFQQRLRIGGTLSEDGSEIVDPIALLPYTDVPPDVYDEVYVGEFTLEEAGKIDFISLIAANTGSNGNNTLTLDYLKLIPVIQ